MPVNINASTSSGIGITADNSGQIVLQTNGANTVVFPTSGTVTIAAQTGTLNAAGPAFSAYPTSNQAFSATTYTKVQFGTEEFDTNNNFDNTTNYRFTPTVAGYYQINALVGTTTGVNGFGIYLYKNGSLFRAGSATGGAVSNGQSALSYTVYMNGSTDYVEVYLYASTTGTVTGGAAQNGFSGCLVRGA